MDRPQPKVTATGRVTPVVGSSARPASPVKPLTSNATPATTTRDPKVVPKRDPDALTGSKPTFPASPLVSRPPGASKRPGPPGIRPSQLGTLTNNPSRPASPTKPRVPSNAHKPASPTKNARHNASSSSTEGTAQPPLNSFPVPPSSSPALNLIISTLKSQDRAMTVSLKRILLQRQGELEPALNRLDAGLATAEKTPSDNAHTTAQADSGPSSASFDHLIKLVTEMLSSHQTVQTRFGKLENAVDLLSTAISELRTSEEKRDEQVSGRLRDLVSGQDKILSFLETFEPKSSKGKEKEVTKAHIDDNVQDVEMRACDDNPPTPSPIDRPRLSNNSSPFIDLRTLHTRRRSTPIRTTTKPRPSLLHTKEEPTSSRSSTSTLHKVPLPTPISAGNRETSPPLPRPPPPRRKGVASSVPSVDGSDADEDRRTEWTSLHQAHEPRQGDTRPLQAVKEQDLDDDAPVPSSDVEAELEIDEQPQMQETRADTMDSLDGLGEASVQRFPSYADWTQAQKPEESYGMDEGEEPQQQERPDMESIPEADEGDAVAQGPVHDAQEEAGGSQETLLHHEQTPTPTQPVAQWIGSGSSVTVVQPHLETGADESKKPDRPSSIKSASPSPPSATSSKPKSAPTWSPVRPSPKAAVPTRTPESTVSSAPAELGSPEGVKAGEDTADVDMDVDGEEPAVGHDEGDDGNEQLPVDDDEEDEDDEEEEEDQDEPQADAEQEGGAVADDEDEDDILEYRDDDNLNPHLVPVSTLPAVAQGMSYPQIEHKVEEPDDIPESSDREEEDELLDDNDQQDEGPGYFVGQVQFEVQQPRAYLYEKVQQPEPGQPAYKEVHEELGQAYEEDQQPELGQPYGDDQVQEQNWQPEFEAVVEQDEDMDPEPYNDDERVLIEGAQELEFAPDDDEDEDGLGAEVVADPMSPEIPVQGLAHEPVAPQEEHDDAHDDEALDEPLKLNTFLDPDSAGHEDEPEADVTPTKAASIREESVELGAPPPQPITQLQPALPVVVAKPLSQVSSSTTKPPSATQLRPIVSLQAQQSSRPRRPIPLPIPRPDRSISPTKSGDSPLVPSFAPRVLAANSPLMSNRSHVSPTPSEASVRSGPPAPSEYYMSPPPPPPPPSSTALLTSMWDNESITEKGRRVFAPPSVSPPPPPSPQHEMSPELGMEEDSPSSSPLSSAPSSPERRAMPTSTAPTSSAGNENSEARRRDKAKGKAKEVAHTGTGEEDEPIVISSSDEEGEGEDEDDHQPVVSTSKKVDKGKGKARARDGDDSLDIKMEDLQAQMKQKGASTRDQGEGGGGEEGGEEPQAEEDEDESAMTDESDVIPIYKFKRRRRAIGKKTTSTNSGTVAGTPVPGAAAASVDGNASTKSIDDPIRRRLNKLAAGSGEAAGPSGGTGQIQPSAAATKVKKKRKLDLGGESPLEHVQKRVKMSRDHDSDEDEKYMKSKIASKKKGGRKEEVGEKKRGRPKKGTGKREKSTPDQSTEWPEQLTSEEDEFSQKFIGCDLCSEWFHYGCVGIRNETDPRLKKTASFRCPPCQQKGGVARSYKSSTGSSKLAVCGRSDCDKNTGETYFVSNLIGRRPDPSNSGKKTTYQWLVRWAHYAVKDSTWEPEGELDDPTSLIETFWKVIEKEKGKINFETQDMLLLKEAKKVNVDWANK